MLTGPADPYIFGAIATVAASVIAGSFGVMRGLTARIQKLTDLQTVAILKSIEGIKTDVENVRVEVGVLKTRVDGLERRRKAREAAQASTVGVVTAYTPPGRP